MSVIIFIIALAILILVHEFGHFIVAKKLGIRVDEFGLGLPPRLWGKKIGETLYSFNWIPFGGFVKIFGEDPHDEEITAENKTRSFYYKPKWVQASVLSAGVIFNIIFAWLLISFGFMLGFPAPVDYVSGVSAQNPQVVIVQVMPDSPASRGGLRTGDTLLFAAAGPKALQNSDLTPEKVSALIYGSGENTIELLYRRGTENPQTVFIKPQYNATTGKRVIGIAMDMIGTIKLGPGVALYEGARTTYFLTISTAKGLGTFIWDAVTLKADFSQVAGPVGIAGSVGQARELGFVYLLSIIALISINLAIINLVPFPALDGGRLLFVAIEAIIRRPIKPAVVQWTNGIGFALLIILMFIVTGHDILKLL